MNGIQNCATLLDDPTMDWLQDCVRSDPTPQGRVCNDPTPPLCGWRDASTIQVYLRARTKITGGNGVNVTGLTLTLRENAVRPRDGPPPAPPPPPPVPPNAWNASLPPALPPASPPLVLADNAYAAGALSVSVNGAPRDPSANLWRCPMLFTPSPSSNLWRCPAQNSVRRAR